MIIEIATLNPVAKPSKTWPHRHAGPARRSGRRWFGSLFWVVHGLRMVASYNLKRYILLYCVYKIET